MISKKEIRKHFKKIRLKETRHFTLIELMLVMVLITISFMGFTTITSVGIQVGNDAVARGITTDAAEQFLRFNAKLIREDPGWQEMFPDSQSPGDDSVITDETHLQWSETLLVKNEIMQIRFVTDNPDKPFDREIQQLHKDERSVYLYEQLASGYSRYGVIIRPWKKKEDLGNGSWETTLYVEVSYPANQPYRSRTKEVYSLDFFNAPEIALANPVDDEERGTSADPILHEEELN